MINSVFKSLIAFAIGLLLLFSITSCQSLKTPEETTLAFWAAMAENDLKLAKKYCSSQSHSLLSVPQHYSFQNSTFHYGKIVIESGQAKVETQITPAIDNKSSFTTFLVKEDNHWKVDYQRSINDLTSNQLLNEFFKDLNTLGETINKQLEQQLPLIQKEIESLGRELQQQIDNFGNELKKSFPQEKEKTYQESI